MQQMINNTRSIQKTHPTAAMLQWVRRKWDLVGVLALMGSSAVYGVFALVHVGL